MFPIIGLVTREVQTDLGAPFQELLRKAILFIPRLVTELIISVVALPVPALAARWARGGAKLSTQDLETVGVLSRLARWSVLVLGTLFALDQVAFDVTSFVAGLGYAQDVGRALRVFLGALRGVEGVLEDPPPTVLAEELGDSALVVAARFWVDQQSHRVFDVHSAVLEEINEVAEKERIELPYPIQTLRLESAWPMADRGEASDR